MRKKYIFILIVVLFTFNITGCKNMNYNILNNQKENNNTEKQKTKIKYHYEKWDCEVSLDNISYISYFNNQFITINGQLYQFSLSQLFSNERHCKKIDSDIKFTRIINASLISEDNKIYSYSEDDKTLIERRYGFVGGFNYGLFDLYNDIFLFSKSSGSGYDINYEHAIVREKNVYALVDTYNTESDKNEYIKNKIGSLYVDEEFINGYQQIIKTTKRYYYHGIINKDECEKYADIECQWGLKEFSDINKIYDEILYFDGYFIIFKNDIKNLYFYYQ